MKKYITFLLSFIFLSISARCQFIHQDELVKITGYIIEADSSILIQIENISDSVLILNEKSINYESIKENIWAADLSIVSSGISLLQPGYGQFMNFQRLLPKTKCTYGIYNFPIIDDIDSFVLFIQIDYISVSSQLSLKDNILYRHFIELIESEDLRIHSYYGDLGIKSMDSDNRCIMRLISK